MKTGIFNKIFLIFLLAIALEQASMILSAQGAESLNVEVSFEVPLIKYYIYINHDRGSLEFEIKIPGSAAICSALSSGIRLQPISISTYIVNASSSGTVLCAASSTVTIQNSSVEAVIQPLIVNGNVVAIERVWLPYYVINISSMPHPTRISVSDNEGYVLEFNTTDPIHIFGRIIPIPRIQAQQPSSNEWYISLAYQALLIAAGVAVGGAMVKLLPMIRSRLERRNVEKDIIELLSKNPRGMSLSMISKTLNTPKSSTWKKLRKLVDEGIVEEFEGPGKGKLYRLKRRDEAGGNNRPKDQGGSTL